MKKIGMIGLLATLLFAESCEDWYKKMRAKYHITGTKAGIVMDQNGNWKKLFAKGTGAIDFDDPDEYEDAISEAEMKAKAELTHFLKEEVTSDKFLNNISKKLKEIKGNGTTQTKNINKKTLKIKSEQIKNSAHSLLKGIVVLCESVDPKQHKAIVVIGVSPKTQRAADSARASMYKNSSPVQTSIKQSAPSTKTKIKGYMDASDNLDF